MVRLRLVVSLISLEAREKSSCSGLCWVASTTIHGMFGATLKDFDIFGAIVFQYLEYFLEHATILLSKLYIIFRSIDYLLLLYEWDDGERFD